MLDLVIIRIQEGNGAIGARVAGLVTTLATECLHFHLPRLLETLQVGENLTRRRSTDRCVKQAEKKLYFVLLTFMVVGLALR